MEDFIFDETEEAAMIFAEMIARAHANRNGDMVHLFATFVGMVIEEDREIGLRCLEAADQWFA
jgi:predicted aconitase